MGVYSEFKNLFCMPVFPGILCTMPDKTPVKRRYIGRIIFLTLALLFWLGILLMPSSRPENLGVVKGNLRGCPDSPNCVSTAAVDVSHHAPGIAFTGSVADARNRLFQIMSQMPRTTLVTEDQNYLHFECRSRLFRFVDDLEFLIDPDARVIQVRSASRVGYSDLGVNRARVNQVRTAFDSNHLDQ